MVESEPDLLSSALSTIFDTQGTVGRKKCENKIYYCQARGKLQPSPERLEVRQAGIMGRKIP